MKTTKSNHIWRREGPQILAVVIALVLPAAAGAQKVKEVEVVNAPPLGFQLVGFTSATFDGSQGVLGFTLACQAEFPGSRMCTSVEVMETINVPAGLTGDAWVRPVFEGGRDKSGAANVFDSLSCEGWSNTSPRGLVVDSNGSFTDHACSLGPSVACCAPVE